MPDDASPEIQYVSRGPDERVRAIPTDVPPATGGRNVMPVVPLHDARWDRDGWPERDISELLGAVPPEGAAADESVSWLGRVLTLLRRIGDESLKTYPPVEDCGGGDPYPWPPDEEAANLLAKLIVAGASEARRLPTCRSLGESLANLAVRAADQRFHLLAPELRRIDEARTEVIEAESRTTRQTTGVSGGGNDAESAERVEDEFVFSMRATFDRIRYLVEQVEELTPEECVEREAWLIPPMSGCPNAGSIYRWDRHVGAFFVRVGAKYDIPDFAVKVAAWSRDFLRCAAFHGGETPFPVATFDELSQRLDALIDEWDTLVVVRRIQAENHMTAPTDRSEHRRAAEAVTNTERSASAPGPVRDLPTFPPLQLRNMTGLSATTINDYAKRSGVQTPGRGQRNFRYTRADVCTILTHIIDNSNEERVVRKCEAALEALPKIKV